MRAALLILIACAGATGACAKAPDVKTNAETKPEADASAEAKADAGRVTVPGLPMPQQFPHVVWDAAAADASARDAAR